MWPVRIIRERRLRAAIAQRHAAHSGGDESARRAEQMLAFNRIWASVRERVPFYRELAQRERLPAAFQSWRAVAERLPVMTRDLIRREGARLHDPSRPPDWFRTTGGSTAQPLQLPAWESERAATGADIWVGRGWYGIRPRDRMFMLWGHRHLLGEGLRARWRGFARQVRDRLAGYYRASAYDLRPEALRAVGDALLRFRPDYMIGYSVALDLLARANAARAAEFARLRLKAVIATAEGFPSGDSEALVGGVLGAPVAMEYGAVETNLIAHTRASGGYEVFWRTHAVEAVEAGPNGGHVVRVTSLFPRCLPLIRYEIGDELVRAAGDDGYGVTRFERVLGRCNAFLVLRDGTRIHSEAITHCLAAMREVAGYQAVQRGAAITLNYTGEKPLSAEASEALRRALGRVHRELAGVNIVRVERHQQTAAGKTPMILHVPDGEPAGARGADQGEQARAGA